MALVDKQLDVLWADAELESLRFEYELVRIDLRETTGLPVVVEAHGPIAFRLDGLWDEVIIESGRLVPDDPLAMSAWSSIQARLGPEPPSSGSEDRNRRTFQTLVLTFLDGCQLHVAAARFTSRRGTSGG